MAAVATVDNGDPQINESNVPNRRDSTLNEFKVKWIETKRVNK